VPAGYGLDIRSIDREGWKCPACQGVCPCAACRRKGGAQRRDPASGASSGVGSAGSGLGSSAHADEDDGEEAAEGSEDEEGGAGGGAAGGAGGAAAAVQGGLVERRPQRSRFPPAAATVAASHPLQPHAHLTAGAVYRHHLQPYHHHHHYHHHQQQPPHRHSPVSTQTDDGDLYAGPASVSAALGDAVGAAAQQHGNAVRG
jgi:hypothetical protein